MSSYFVNEPTPTVTGYTHSGRGGAGNTYLPRKSASSSSSSARALQVPKQTTRFYSGIGGAGNTHNPEERSPLSFDEEIDRARIREAAPAGHIGIGGAGNVFRRVTANSDDGTESQQRLSGESQSFWGRLSMSSKQ